MIVFVFTGQTPPVLILTLLVMAYLTGFELSKEKDLALLPKIWWVLVVLLFNILGFGAFWFWLANRRHRRRQDPAPAEGDGS